MVFDFFFFVISVGGGDVDFFFVIDRFIGSYVLGDE